MSDQLNIRRLIVNTGDSVWTTDAIVWVPSHWTRDINHDHRLQVLCSWNNVKVLANVNYSIIFDFFVDFTIIVITFARFLCDWSNLVIFSRQYPNKKSTKFLWIFTSLYTISQLVQRSNSRLISDIIHLWAVIHIFCPVVLYEHVTLTGVLSQSLSV